MKNPRILERTAQEFIKLLPPSAGKEQRHDMRCAFYAGALAFYNIQMAGLSPGLEPQESDMKKMEWLMEEFEDFRRAL